LFAAIAVKLLSPLIRKKWNEYHGSSKSNKTLFIYYCYSPPNS